MKIPINIIRQICKLLDDCLLSLNNIARICKCSPNTVKRIREVKKAKHVKVNNLSDVELEALFYTAPSNSPSITKLDCNAIHSELKKRDMTLQLLWEEYRQYNSKGVSYSQYCRIYKRWLKTCKISMRQVHYPGEHLYVDFCGRTMPIRDAITGTEWKAHIFVGTLGASGYLFAKAVNSQKVADFLHANVAMLEHIGGVTKYIVPDNLKSAVLVNTKEITQINEAYAELSEHYSFSVLPARPRKPKDKSLAEIGAQIVQRFVLARLRNFIFFSLDELNEQINYWMKVLNDRVTKTYTVNRTDRLESIDRASLSPLPDLPYSYSHWAFAQRADETYHVCYMTCWYSVPYAYAHQKVDIRVTGERVDIYHGRNKIATHTLSKESGKTITDPMHRPPNHAYVADSTSEKILAWAESMGSSTKRFLDINFKDHRYYATRLKSALNLRKDVLNNGWQNKLEAACTYALSINSFTFQRLMSILKRPEISHERISNHIVENDNIRGSEYYVAALNDTELTKEEA